MGNKIISNTFTVNTIENGESTFDVTLDNQIAGVECDSSGNIIDSSPITLHLSAYYGNGEDLIAECYISESHDDDAIMVSEVDTGVIGVELTQGAYLAPSNPIVLTVRHPEYGTRVVTFSLNRVVKGKNGENSIRLDLNNEGDTMLYDEAGNLLSGSVSTTATLYDGGTVVSNASFSIQGYSGMDSSKVSISGSTVTVSGMTSDSGYVDIRASYNGKYYTHRFTLKKIVGVDKFDLVVSPNAVSINTSDTTIADTPIEVQVYRTPANGGTRHLVSWTNENGAYYAYGLVLAVKDSENNSLVETTSGTPVTTRTFNFSATQAQNVNITDVTVLLGKRLNPQTPITQDIETIPVSHVRNGQNGTGANAVRLDLDNEMDVIPTDAEGDILQQVTLTTTVRLFNGSTEVPLTTSDIVSIQPIVINGQPYGGIKSGSGGIVITWTIPVGVNVNFDKNTCTIVAQKNGNTYTAKFIVAVLKSGEAGVSPEILSLLPLPNQIVFSKDSSGTIPVSSKTLSLKIKKTIGNTTEIKEVNQSGLTIMYSTVTMPATVNDGTEWRGDISIQSTVTYSNVYIAAFDGNTLVDRETVPIIKDGDKGESVKIESQHASYFDGEDADGNPRPTILSSVDLGKIDLLNYGTGDLDMIDVVEEDGVGGYVWDAYTIPFGTCYFFNDHLYEATETGWADLGLFKGDKGDDAITYEVMCSRESITIPSGETSKSATTSFNFFSKEGDSPKQEFNTYWSLYKRGNDGTMTLTFNTAFKSTYARNLSLPATTSESAFVMYIWGNNRYSGNNPESQSYLAKAEVVVLKNGDNGARGKVGRFYYFAGAFNEEEDTQFVVNDAQVPYFEHFVAGQKRYHVFNPETTPASGSMTMAQMWAASNQSWNNAPWEVMTNDFKYLITEAIFAQFAQFGSAIINGDWMISKHGTLYDTSDEAHAIDATHSWGAYNVDNAYMEFNPEYPNSSEYGEINFAPNYAVDLLTGTTYQKKAFIEGVLRASAFYNRIGGFIEEDGKTWLDLDNNNGNTYILGVSGQTYYLPEPRLYEGMEINIWLKRSTRIATVLREGAEAYLDKIVITIYEGDSSVSDVFLAEAIKSTLLGDEIQLLKIQAIDITHTSGFRDIRWVVTSQRGLLEAFANASDSSGRLITPEGKFFVRSDAETALYHNGNKYGLAISTDSYWTQGENVRIIQY